MSDGVGQTVENIKALIPIGAVIIAIAGFYYTTTHRLDHLETQIQELQVEDKRLRKLVTNKQKGKR